MTRGDEHERHGNGVHIEERELEGQNVWVADDSAGIVAIAQDRDELLRVMAEDHGEDVDRDDEDGSRPAGRVEPEADPVTG